MEKKRLKKTQKESMIKREDKHSRNKRGENIDRKDGSPKESQSQMDRTGTCDSSTVSVMTWIGGNSLAEQNAQNLAQQQLLEEKIAEEEARSKELDEYSEYMKTDEFAEWYAKEKLGLIHKNEIIFKGE